MKRAYNLVFWKNNTDPARTVLQHRPVVRAFAGDLTVKHNKNKEHTALKTHTSCFPEINNFTDFFSYGESLRLSIRLIVRLIDWLIDWLITEISSIKLFSAPQHLYLVPKINEIFIAKLYGSPAINSPLTMRKRIIKYLFGRLPCTSKLVMRQIPTSQDSQNQWTAPIRVIKPGNRA